MWSGGIGHQVEGEDHRLMFVQPQAKGLHLGMALDRGARVLGGYRGNEDGVEALA